MKSCWEERPAARPTFAEITRNSVLQRAATPSDMLYPEDDEEDMITNLDFNIHDFMNDSESLVTSILKLLPGSEQVEADVHPGTELVTTPTSCGSQTGDCYTDMKPLSRPLSRVARNGTLTEYDHYNQAPANNKPSGPPQRNCSLVRAHSAHDKSKSVHVSRNASNCSDYYPMSAAEPARAKIN